MFLLILILSRYSTYTYTLILLCSENADPLTMIYVFEGHAVDATCTYMYMFVAIPTRLHASSHLADLVSTPQSKKERPKNNNEAPTDNEQRAAWTAIRCATAAGAAQRSRLLLVGDPSVTTQQLSTRSAEQMPDCIALDLIGSYILGEKTKLYKSTSRHLQRLWFHKCQELQLC